MELVSLTDIERIRFLEDGCFRLAFKWGTPHIVAHQIEWKIIFFEKNGSSRHRIVFGKIEKKKKMGSIRREMKTYQMCSTLECTDISRVCVDINRVALRPFSCRTVRVFECFSSIVLEAFVCEDTRAQETKSHL